MEEYERAVKEPKIVATKPNQRKEVKIMSLSLGTWILLIIVMIIITKIAHKFSSRPTKGRVQKTHDRYGVGDMFAINCIYFFV